MAELKASGGGREAVAYRRVPAALGDNDQSDGLLERLLKRNIPEDVKRAKEAEVSAISARCASLNRMQLCATD